MSVTLSSSKNNLIKKIAEDEGFKDYTTEVKSGSMKGDGYLGIINTVQIKEKNSEKCLNLILKSASDLEKFRQLAPVKKAFEREIYMYQTIFPEFLKFAQEREIPHKFTEHPRCYGTLLDDKEECLALQNLKEIGFKLWDRMTPMNADHVGQIFRSYGKLHGFSLALKNLEVDRFENIRNKMANIFEGGDSEKKMGESMGRIFENGFKSVKGNEEATAALTKFAETCGQFFMVETKNVNKTFCFLHGDCWCNNMMFIYEDKNNPEKPTGANLIDFQIASFGSPVLDLSYFFYACSSKEVLYDLDKFLKIYHDTLSEVLEEAGLSPDSIMSFEELQEEWKKFSKYGLFMTIFVMNVMVSNSDEAPDFGEMAESGKDILESITSKPSANLELLGLKRIANVIIFMMERNLL